MAPIARSPASLRRCATPSRSPLGNKLRPSRGRLFGLRAPESFPHYRQGGLCGSTSEMIPDAIVVRLTPAPRRGLAATAAEDWGCRRRRRSPRRARRTGRATACLQPGHASRNGGPCQQSATPGKRLAALPLAQAQPELDCGRARRAPGPHPPWSTIAQSPSPAPPPRVSKASTGSRAILPHSWATRAPWQPMARKPRKLSGQCERGGPSDGVLWVGTIYARGR